MMEVFNSRMESRSSVRPDLKLLTSVLREARRASIVIDGGGRISLVTGTTSALRASSSMSLKMIRMPVYIPLGGVSLDSILAIIVSISETRAYEKNSEVTGVDCGEGFALP